MVVVKVVVVMMMMIVVNIAERVSLVGDPVKELKVVPVQVSLELPWRCLGYSKILYWGYSVQLHPKPFVVPHRV